MSSDGTATHNQLLGPSEIGYAKRGSEVVELRFVCHTTTTTRAPASIATATAATANDGTAKRGAIRHGHRERNSSERESERADRKSTRLNSSH